MDLSFPQKIKVLFKTPRRHKAGLASSAKRPKSKGAASRLGSHDFGCEEQDFNWLMNSVKGSHFKLKKHMLMKSGNKGEGTSVPKNFVENFCSFDQPNNSTVRAMLN